MDMGILVPTGPLDDLDALELEAFFDTWCRQSCASNLPLEELDHYFNISSTRCTFLKSMPEHGALVDMGAGNGALSVYKVWPPPRRQDLDLYGVSLDPVERASDYTAISISNFEENPSPFGDMLFDGVVASHFVEHLSDPDRLIGWIARSLKPGGRAYIEWPHQVSMRMPTRSFFQERGIPLFTTRFDDDRTHIDAWDVTRIATAAGRVGLRTETVGRVHSSFMGAQLRDAARQEHDNIRGTFAVWYTAGWAQYIVLTKPALPSSTSWPLAR